MCIFAFVITQETIQRIREAARVEEVVGEFVSLKKHGAAYIACCPFHHEKTPSFHVNPARGIYKCFGCGEGGDSVSFLMKHEHYTYPEALRYLAKKYNIEIADEVQTDEEKQRQSERDAIFHVTEFAQKHFADLLFNDEMGRAVGLSYFHNRGLSDDIIRRFGLGYCLDEWSAFTDFARKNGYSDAALDKSGLTIFKEEGKCYDRFRGRVMFPIFSISGRVLGFSGRVLSKEKQTAKYVNSPESEIYTKGNILYGLFQARQAIARADKCYLVEGNVDVVSMHQSGVENTVASCGTALTPQQIRLIKRYTPNVTVLYDGDSAGIKATIKAVNLLFAEGMHVRVVLFPDGDDPDSYAQKYGSSQLQQYLSDHEENFLMYRMRLASEAVRRDPIRKAELETEIVKTIALVPDPLERSEYLVHCASLFSVTEQTLTALVAKEMARLRTQGYKELQSQMAAASQPADSPDSQSSDTLPQDDFNPVEAPIAPQVAPQQTLMSTNPAEAQENQIVNILVAHGSELYNHSDKTIAQFVVNDILNDELTFDDPVCQHIFDFFATAIREEKPLPDANFFATCEDVAVRNKALAFLIAGYQISPKWEQDHNIIVPSLESRLSRDVTESINNFKLKKLQQRMDAVDQQLRLATDPEEQYRLISLKTALVKLHILIAHDKLNRVIS